MRSKRFWLNTRDFVKGSFVAIVAALIELFRNEMMLNSDFDLILLKKMAWAALVASLSYLFKNFLENSEGKFTSER